MRPFASNPRTHDYARKPSLPSPFFRTFNQMSPNPASARLARNHQTPDFGTRLGCQIMSLTDIDPTHDVSREAGDEDGTVRGSDQRFDALRHYVSSDGITEFRTQSGRGGCIAGGNFAYQNIVHRHESKTKRVDAST